MSTVVTGLTKQKKPYDVYVDGACDKVGCDHFWDIYHVPDRCAAGGCLIGQYLGACKSDEWKVGSVHCFCGNDQPICSRVDPEVCPSLPGKDGSARIKAEFVDLSSATDKEATVKCSYDLSKITTTDQVETWKSTFGMDESYMNSIMPNFCSKASHECPGDPVTGQPLETCSRILGTGADGKICREWAGKSKVNPNYYAGLDRAMTTYCNDNPKSVQCQCINRGMDPLYKAAGGESSLTDVISPFCWWRPCKDPDKYLVTSSLFTAKCPSNFEVCQQIHKFTAEANSTIQAKDFESKIACSFNSTPSPNTPPPGPITPPSEIPPVTPITPPSEIPPVTPITPPSFFQKYKLWIIIGVAAVVIIIIIVVILIVTTKKGPTTTVISHGTGLSPTLNH